MTTSYPTTSARRAANTTSANVPGACQTQPDGITFEAAVSSFRLTAARMKALAFLRDAHRADPGYFRQPRRGTAAVYAALLKEGYVERIKVANGYRGTYAESSHWEYRLTPQGRALVPAPAKLRRRCVDAHAPRPLTAGQVARLRAFLTWKNPYPSRRLIIHPDGATCTAWLRCPDYLPARAASGRGYTLDQFVEDWIEHLRLAIPAAFGGATVAIEAVRTYEPRPIQPGPYAPPAFDFLENPRVLACWHAIEHARAGAWVAITFCIPNLLLAAENPVAPEPEPAVSVNDWPVELAPEVDETPLGQWRRLPAEAQAVLVTLHRAGVAAPVRGASESALRTLDHELLIFRWPQLQEARISSRGLDLVEAMQIEGEIWSQADHDYAVSYVAAGSAEEVRRSLGVGS